MPTYTVKALFVYVYEGIQIKKYIKMIFFYTVYISVVKLYHLLCWRCL